MNLRDVLNILDLRMLKNVGRQDAVKGENGHREQKLIVEFPPVTKTKTSGDTRGHSGIHSTDTKCMHSTLSGMSAPGMSF